MSRALVALFVSLTLTACAAPAVEEAAPTHYTGTLNAELISFGLAPGGGLMSPADNFDVAAMGDLVPEGATVKVADVAWHRDREVPQLRTFVVQRGDDDLYVIVDVDGDGEFERHAFVNSADPLQRSEVTVEIPLEDGPFDVYPLVITLPDFASMGMEATPETDALSVKGPMVEGVVEIDGRIVDIKLPYDFRDHTISLSGRQMLDADGNGTIDTWFTSRETVYHRVDEPAPIYRVGDRYVSFDSVDQDAGTFTLITRDPDEYSRIELDLGGELPDFTFTDFEGNERRLHEFRGKIVLVDIWGSWCGPCREDVPYHLAAYAKYKDLGFEIVGLDDEQSDDGEFDEGLQKGRGFVAEHGMTWTQATEESVKGFLVDGIQVGAWPTTILLDREGTIISLGRPQDEYGLRHDDLDETLGKLLGSDR